MGMSLTPASGSDDAEVLSDINTTPLIDVMLVLLIMLIITIPVQLHAVNLDMPSGNPPPPTVKPEVVQIDIDASGLISWNGAALADLPALQAKLATAATQAIQPELHVRPDRQAAYRAVATLMAAAQQQGLTKIGIIGNEQFQ